MDPFEETNDLINNFDQVTIVKITIRIDKRNAKKSTTTIENWNLPITELKTHLKKLKTTHGCNGSVKEKNGEIIFKLSGDKRDEVINFLKETGVSEKDINVIG